VISSVLFHTFDRRIDNYDPCSLLGFKELVELLTLRQRSLFLFGHY
jgi:hypothetical protein